MHVEPLAWISFLRIWNFWYSADFSFPYGSWLLDFMAKSWVYREVIWIQWIKSKKAFNQSEKFQCKFSCNLRTIFGNIMWISMEFSAKGSFKGSISHIKRSTGTDTQNIALIQLTCMNFEFSSVKAGLRKYGTRIFAKPIFEKLCAHLNTFSSWWFERIWWIRFNLKMNVPSRIQQ